MNLRQLEAFQAIMVTGSATAAAGQLHQSQSAVSRTLAQLEEDLGLRLFRREKGRLVPTREAQALCQDVQLLLESAQCLRLHTEQLRRGGFSRRLLKVAVPEVLATTLLPQLAARFMTAYPDVVMEVVGGTYAEAERAILSREADLGFVRLPLEMPGLEVLSSFDSDLVCVLPHGHALESESEITPTLLEGFELILLGRQSRNRQELEFAFRRANVMMKVAVETRSAGIACGFVASGLGIALVNALIASWCSHLPVVIRPFAPKLTFRHGFALMKNAPAAALCKAFSGMVTDAIVRQSVQGHPDGSAPAATSRPPSHLA